MKYTYNEFMADLKAACDETEADEGYELTEEPHQDDFVEMEFSEMWEDR